MRPANTTAFLIALALLLSPFTIQGQAPDEKELEVFRAATTVRIVVRQSLPEGTQLSLPLATIAGDLLSAAGLKIITQEDVPADLTVVITAKGTPLGTRYYDVTGIAFPDSPYSVNRDTTGTVFYVSAQVGGRINFIPAGKSEWSAENYSEVFPPSRYPQLQPRRTSGGPTDPAGAPFLEAFWANRPEAFPTQLLMMIGTIYGKEPLRAALKHPDERIRDCAKWAWLRLYKEDLLIAPGMEEQEVIRLLGTPGVTNYEPGKKIMKYPYHIVEIEDGKVTSVTLP
jgi:hypothetical protein